MIRKNPNVHSEIYKCRKSIPGFSDQIFDIFSRIFRVPEKFKKRLLKALLFITEKLIFKNFKIQSESDLKILVIQYEIFECRKIGSNLPYQHLFPTPTSAKCSNLSPWRKYFLCFYIVHPFDFYIYQCITLPINIYNYVLIKIINVNIF